MFNRSIPDIEGYKLIRADHPDKIKRWSFHLL